MKAIFWFILAIIMLPWIGLGQHFTFRVSQDTMHVTSKLTGYSCGYLVLNIDSPHLPSQILDRNKDFIRLAAVDFAEFDPIFEESKVIGFTMDCYFDDKIIHAYDANVRWIGQYIRKGESLLNLYGLDGRFIESMTRSEFQKMHQR